MSVPRLFHGELGAGRVALSAEESRHAGSVLRCEVGDAVRLFDGEGREARATVFRVGRDGVTVDVEEAVTLSFGEAIKLTLAVAMPRKQRQAYLFEKCTELGVWEIWPTICERSVVKPKADQVGKWRRTSIEAAKQCGRCWIPRIEKPVSFDETILRAGAFDRLVVTTVDTSSRALTEVLSERADERVRAKPSSALVWIGPEGGLREAEVEAACAAGAVRAHLGENVLRVETAAATVVAVALLGGGSCNLNPLRLPR